MKRFCPARPDSLQLDIDNADDLVHFHKSFPWLSCIANEHGFPIRSMDYRRSKTPNHWHITIRFSKRLPVMERIALQAILGSDRARELCNWERVKCRSAHPILFVEPLQISPFTPTFVSAKAKKRRK